MMLWQKSKKNNQTALANVSFNPENSNSLQRCLSPYDLIFLGIGAIIGAGIFVITGIAAATKTGPAIILSYIIAGFACGCTALSYAELASSIGGCGSAYHYASKGFGTFIAWIVGWDLLLEYALTVSAVSVGWSSYIKNLLQSFHLSLPYYLMNSPFHDGLINLPSLTIVVITAILLSLGAKISARFNSLIVMIKLLVIALFIAIAFIHLNPIFWSPFMPYGWHGVMSGAALIFFAYIGFDAVSTAAEEAIEPQKTMPIAIIGSLIICTLIYIVVSGLLTGVVSYKNLNISSPIAEILLHLGYRLAASFVAVGAIAGLTTVILVMYYGLTRIFLAMSRDGLLPRKFSQIHSVTKTPVLIILFTGVIMALFSGLIPIEELVEMVNIGTLTAFAAVCMGVIVMRYKYPEMPRPFKAPFTPLIPSLGFISCLYLMVHLPVITWIRFIVWMMVGLLIYFFYSRKNLSVV